MEGVMADFDPGDVIRLGCVQKVATLYDVVNVLHVVHQGLGSHTIAQMTADIQEYTDVLFGKIVSYVTNAQTASSISVKNMTQNKVWGNIAWGSYAGGGNASERTPYQVALLAYGRTTTPRVQIRKYLGVFAEVDCVAGLWAAGIRNACQQFIDYHIVPAALTNGAILQGCAYRPSDGRVTLALSGATSEVPVIQRRRRQGRGS
jgi:hypothetical protein